MKKVFSRTLQRLLSSSSSISMNFLLGAWKSTVSGQGLEVKEIRPFSPGDNPLAAVWSRFAQTGTLFAKNFQEERGRLVYVALDLSGSMFQGGKAKAEFARELFAYLVWAASQSSDKVGAILNEASSIRVITPRAGSAQAELLIQESERVVDLPSPASLASFFSDEAGHELKRSYLLYISDFLEPSRDWKSVFLKLAHHHEVRLFHLIDDEYEHNLTSAVGLTCFNPEEKTIIPNLFRRGTRVARHALVESERKRVVEEARLARVPLHGLSVHGECLTELVEALQGK